MRRVLSRSLLLALHDWLQNVMLFVLLSVRCIISIKRITFLSKHTPLMISHVSLLRAVTKNYMMNSFAKKPIGWFSSQMEK